MAAISYLYKDPTTGAALAASDDVVMEMYDAEDGSKKAVLVARRGGVTSINDCRVDITDRLKQAIYGNSMEAPPGMYMTRLSAQEVGLSPGNTTLSVENSGAPTDALPLGLNAVAVGGLAPTLWSWRTVPVLRWFLLGGSVGVLTAWVALLSIALLGA